jgi:hypothetical protein
MGGLEKALVGLFSEPQLGEMGDEVIGFEVDTEAGVTGRDTIL